MFDFSLVDNPNYGWSISQIDATCFVKSMKSAFKTENDQKTDLTIFSRLLSGFSFASSAAEGVALSLNVTKNGSNLKSSPIIVQHFS